MKSKLSFVVPIIATILVLSNISVSHANSGMSESSAPSSPTLIEPQDETTTTGASHPPLGLPALSWTPVEGATSYRIEISTSVGFSDPIVNETTYSTKYVPKKAFADGEYFWRVKARIGAAWGEYSDTFSFTKNWDNNGALRPVLVAPVNNSTRTTYEPGDFNWKPVVGAAGYLLEIAMNDTFSNIVYEAKTTKAQHTPTVHLTNNNYFWRVTPHDNQNNFGTPSESFALTFDWNNTPQLLAPEDNVDLVYSPTLSWTAVEGAKMYHLEIDTEDDFPSADTCICYSTNYTWYKNLSNDQEYFWRVKALDNSGNSSPWSEVRRFRIKWNFEPERLSPPNNVIHQASPYFSWEPIPGAERYQFQVDESTSFQYPKTDIEVYNVTHAGLVKIKDAITYIDRDYFWRVRGIDAQDNYTPWTEVRSFRFGWETSPAQIYPPFYYEPDLVNLPDARDETIDQPLFIWHAAHKWQEYPIYSQEADYYEITVAADEAYTDIVFQSETSGLAASPTLDNPFEIQSDDPIYYWRVRAFINNQTIGADATWVTRIDPSKPQMPLTSTVSILYPEPRAEVLVTAPVIGWFPVEGAHHYRIQLSRSSDFSQLVEDERPQFNHYVPGQGQRTRMGYGTYWYRVRAQDEAGEPLTDWSDSRSFNMSIEIYNSNQYDLVPAPHPYTIMSNTLEYKDEAQTEIDTWYESAWTKVATDTDDGVGALELTDLHVVLNRIKFTHDTYPEKVDNYSWVITFRAPTVTAASVYAVYIDSDHVPGSGGTSDPLGNNIAVDDMYLPEYVVYVQPDGSDVSAASVSIYSWSGSNWTPEKTLDSVGGDAWHSTVDQGLQLIIPYTTLSASISEDLWSGSLAIAVFSLDSGTGGNIVDSLPAQGARLDNPVFVSDMVMPLYPLNSPLNDPMIFYDMPAFHWRMPGFGSIDGYELEVARDDEFTDLVETWDVHESEFGAYFAMLTSIFQSLNAYEDNESYYWRVRLRHESYSGKKSEFDFGPWSPARRLRLGSRNVGNPTVSTGDLADTTPYFYWDRVDGASGYRIEIDDDINFSKQEVDEDVDTTSFALTDEALADGTWYWRVAPRRSHKVRGDWSPAMSFVKRSIAPTPVSPANKAIINEQPTFSWTAVLTPTLSPRVSAPEYRLMIDDDPNFGTPKKYDTDATSYTLSPRDNLADGTWYWRVAMLDTAGNVGTYSPVQQFYKEFLPPVRLSPGDGSGAAHLTTFQWEPIAGAAYYEFEYADNEFYNRSKKIKTDNTSYVPTSKPDDDDFYWRVRMYDDDNNPGPYVVGRVTAISYDVYLPYAGLQHSAQNVR